MRWFEFLAYLNQGCEDTEAELNSEIAEKAYLAFKARLEREQLFEKKHYEGDE